MEGPIQYSTTTGTKVIELMLLLSKMFQNEDPNAVHVACLAFATMMVNPEIDPDKLREIVKGLSEYISMAMNTGTVN